MKLSLKKRMWIRYGIISILSAMVGCGVSYIFASMSVSESITAINKIISDNAPTTEPDRANYFREVADGLDSAAATLKAAAVETRKSSSIVIVSPPTSVSGPGEFSTLSTSMGGGLKSAPTTYSIEMSTTSMSVATITFSENIVTSEISINGNKFTVMAPSGQNEKGIGGDIKNQQIIGLYTNQLMVGRLDIRTVPVSNRDAYMTLYCPPTNRTGISTVSTGVSGNKYTYAIAILGCPGATTSNPPLVTPPPVPTVGGTPTTRADGTLIPTITINGRTIYPGLGIWQESFAEPIIRTKNGSSIVFAEEYHYAEAAKCQSTEVSGNDCDAKLNTLCFYNSGIFRTRTYQDYTGKMVTVSEDEKVRKCVSYPVLIGKLIQAETSGDVGDPFTPYTYKPVVGARLDVNARGILGTWCDKKNFGSSTQYGYFGVTFAQRNTQGMMPDGVLGNLVKDPCAGTSGYPVMAFFNITATSGSESVTVGYTDKANDQYANATYHEKTYLFKTKITDTTKVLSTSLYCDSAKNQVWDKITMKDGSLKYKYTGYKCGEVFYN